MAADNATSGGGADRTETTRDPARTEAFSDAVLAIIITLMAVELLQVEVVPGRLLATTLSVWPFYLAFLLSFAIVGQVWITHHNMWRYVVRVDQPLLILNLVLLFFVALLPYSARLLGVALHEGDAADQHAATAIYAAVVLGEAVAFNLSWRRACRAGLLDARMGDALRRAIGRRYLLGPVLYVVAFLLTFVSPIASLVSYLLLVGLYVVPGAGDLPGRQRRSGSAVQE